MVLIDHIREIVTEVNAIFMIDITSSYPMEMLQ